VPPRSGDRQSRCSKLGAALRCSIRRSLLIRAACGAQVELGGGRQCAPASVSQWAGRYAAQPLVRVAMMAFRHAVKRWKHARSSGHMPADPRTAAAARRGTFGTLDEQTGSEHPRIAIFYEDVKRNVRRCMSAGSEWVGARVPEGVAPDHLAPPPAFGRSAFKATRACSSTYSCQRHTY